MIGPDGWCKSIALWWLLGVRLPNGEGAYQGAYPLYFIASGWLTSPKIDSYWPASWIQTGMAPPGLKKISDEL